MYTCDNIKNNEDFKSINNIGVLYIDIRNSLDVNKSKDVSKIYNDFLNLIYSKMEKNGIRHIDIQGDGIYGICESFSKQKQTFCKVVSDVIDIMNHLKEKYNVLTTISINLGNEKYSCFGSKQNGEKQIVFVGNVVAGAKRNISRSGQTTKVIVSDKNVKNECFNGINKNYLINLELLQKELENKKK